MPLAPTRPLPPTQPLLPGQTQPTAVNPVATSQAPAASSGAPFALNAAIPGLQRNTSSASELVNRLLNGLPGTASARRAGAYFGATSGMPGSEFARNRGYDIYGEEAESRNQRGFQDLLAMISGYSSPIYQERGQNIQQSQFGQSLAQQQAEFSANLALQKQKLDAELKKMGFDPNRYSRTPHMPAGVPGYQQFNQSLDDPWRGN